MRNAKKTLSLVMVAIFTTFIVLSGLPASAATISAAAKSQTSKATYYVVKAEAVATTYSVAVAKNQYAVAVKEVRALHAFGASVQNAYLGLSARVVSLNKLIAARASVNTDLVAAEKLVDTAEALTDTDTYDLTNADGVDLANAQNAVTDALEGIVKLDKDSAGYKGLMARVDAANAKIIAAMDTIQSAADQATELKAETDATAAVVAIETAGFANTADAAAATALVASVQDATISADLTARLAKITAPAKIVTVSAVDGTITVTLDKPLTTMPAPTDVVLTKTVTAATAVTSAVTPSAVTTNGAVVTITVPAIAQDPTTSQAVVYTVALGTQAPVSSAAYTVAKVAAVDVVSVTPLNLRQVQFVFNKALDATSADLITNYYANLVAIPAGTAKAELQADNKTVIVTYLAAQTQGTAVSYTVSGVKSANLLETTASVATSVTFLDTTVPTVTNVTVTGNNSIEVTYSEPVNGPIGTPNAVINSANYTMDGYSLSAYGMSVLPASTTGVVTAVVGSPGYADALSTTNLVSKNNVVDFTFAVAIPAGNHTFGVVGGAIADAAGFFVQATTKTITVISDLTPPTFVSVTNNGLTTIDMTFSKAVKLPAIANIKLNGYALTTGSVSNPDSTNLAKVEISGINTAAGALVAGANIVEIAIGGMVDYYGNSNAAAIRFGVTAAADVTPPVVSLVASADDTHITVTYSETMNATAGNAANYAVKNGLGTVVATPYSATTTDNLTYTLLFTTPVAGGVYTLATTNVQDSAGNIIVPASNSVSVTDSHGPSVTSATIVSTDLKQVKLVFSEAMNYASIVTLTNYQYAGAALLPGTTVTPAADNTSVILTFPSPLTLANQGVGITTILLKDVAGNYELSYNENSTIYDSTTIAPVLLRATATSTTTMTVEYKNALTTLDPTDFAYALPNSNTVVKATTGYLVNTNVFDKSVDANGVVSDSTTAVAGSKIYLTFPANTIDTAALGTFSIVGHNSKDALLNAIDNVPSNMDTKGVGINGVHQGYILPTLVVDKTTPALIGITAKNATAVVLVKYSEKLQPGLASLFMNDFTVTSGGATMTISSSKLFDAYTIELDLSSNLTSLNGLTTYVTPKTVPTYVQDVNANLYVPTTADLTSGTLIDGYTTVAAPVVLPAVTVATNAVVTAETSFLQADKDLAKGLVDALAAGTERSGLEARLTVLQSTIDANVAAAAATAAANLLDAQNKVAAATAADIAAVGPTLAQLNALAVANTAAQTAVDKLASGATKTALQATLTTAKTSFTTKTATYTTSVKTALETSLTAAQNDLAAAVIGVATGNVTLAQHNTLNAAINAASVVDTASGSVAADYVSAKTTLDAALAAFDAGKHL